MQPQKDCGFNLKWCEGGFTNWLGYQMLFQKEGASHRRQPPDVVSFERAMSNWDAFYLIRCNMEVCSNLFDYLRRIWLVHGKVEPM